MSVALKICGITRAEDLRVCVELGVDAVGLNFWPGSKRYLEREAGRAMLAPVPATPTGADSGGPRRVGVFVDAPLAEVAATVEAWGLHAIQPHGDAPVEPYAELAAELGVDWIWVIRGTPDLASLLVPQPAPAVILLDAAVAGFGGAGQTTDWDWAARAVRALAPLPVWIAGGIRPENVTEALERVGPAGVDVASGAEIPGAGRGHKSRAAIEALVRACRSRPA